MSQKAIQWEQDALERINQAPFFIRPIAKRKVEKVAARMGQNVISLSLVEQVKQQHMDRKK